VRGYAIEKSLSKYFVLKSQLCNEIDVEQMNLWPIYVVLLEIFLLHKCIFCGGKLFFVKETSLILWHALFKK